MKITYQSLKQKAYHIMNATEEGGLTGPIINSFILLLIIGNIVALILETVEEIASPNIQIFRTFESFSVIIFTIEYLLRLWSITSNPVYQKPAAGRARFALTPLAIIDILAILPFYLPMILPIDLRFLRALRMVRLFRIFKVVRYTKSFKLMGNVFRSRKEELIITIAMVSLLLIVVSSLMYYIEHDAQPEVFKSILHSMWWGIATLTTIGYGDAFPITPLGKILGGMTAILGIGIFALPAGILGSGFVEELQKSKKEKKVCPHCGKELE
jgi:voltage-gated potassium channel